jgi:hypothetical protein
VHVRYIYPIIEDEAIAIPMGSSAFLKVIQNTSFDLIHFLEAFLMMMMMMMMMMGVWCDICI